MYISFSDGLVSLIGLTFYVQLFAIVKKIVAAKLDACQSAGTVSDVSVRIVSLCQGALSSLVGLLTVVICRDIMTDKFWFVNYYVHFTFPYFPYDVWAMYKTHILDNPHLEKRPIVEKIRDFFTSNTSIVLHHTMLPLVLCPFLLFWRRGLGDYFVGCLMLMEVTVPLVSLRFILARLQMKNSKLYVMVGFSMVVVFGLVRVAIFPFLYARYAVYSGIPVLQVPFQIPLIYNLGCLLILSFQVYWFSLMIRGLIKVVGKMYRGTKST